MNLEKKQLAKLNAIQKKFQALYDAMLSNEKSKYVQMAREIKFLAEEYCEYPDVPQKDLVYVHIAFAMAASTTGSIGRYAMQNKQMVIYKHMEKAKALLLEASEDEKFHFNRASSLINGLVLDANWQDDWI